MDVKKGRPDPMPDCSPSMRAALESIAAHHPGVPLLTLGQTVFWDEPVKATVRLAMKEVCPETPFVAAVHDTDYFARPHATLSSTHPYVILGHNDGSTRNLWCAAAELSALFGAETVFTAAAMRSAGVRLDAAARFRDEPTAAILDRYSEAWGWRGIAHTNGVETLAYEVPTAGIAETLLSLLDAGFASTAETMCHCTGTASAEAVGDRIRSEVADFAAAHPDGSLSDLYQKLFPFMHGLVSGETPEGMWTGHSLQESRFGLETAELPRFRILDLFLQPESREICRSAYDRAVVGSEIYPLEKFGEGAIPFDIITREGGRGPIRVLEEGVHIEGRRPEFIPTPTRIGSVQELAAAVEDHFGGPVNLVGKAITWISILATDYVFVMHEGASGYTPRTHHMLEEIRSRGFDVPMHPILRVQYDTWDSLKDVASGFCLPDHYARAFGQREISARDFASRWRTVMDEQESLLLELGQLRRPMDLLLFLNERSGGQWQAALESYREAQGLVRARNAAAVDYDREMIRLREEHFQCGMQIDHLQKRRGALRKLAQTGTDVRSERDAVDHGIAGLRHRRRDLERSRQELREEMRAIRDEVEYRAAQATLRQIEGRAELERLQIARSAFLVAHSLEYINRRPTAWWLPIVSPDGAWFRGIYATARAYLEVL